MEKRLTADLNVVANSNLEIQLLDGDLNIIQKLDDEPNDVGGLTSAELKAKFDESGNIIKKYINETLIPAVLTDDATEESRKQAEAARVAAEQGRVTAEEGRKAAETSRDSAETARQSAETARSGAESTRQSKENARQAAETARANAEKDRQAAETRRGDAETSRASAESERRNAESSRVTAEGGRASAEASRVTAEQGRTSAESIRVQNEQKRVSAENSRVEAEAQRAAAEQARADENTGIVAQATAQANAAAQSAGIASASAQTAQSAASSAGTAASTASSAAASASGSASQAQASAAAAAKSAASVDGINKTAQSWAVGGTNTRPGEDTDNAKYWAEQAQAVVGGDFATKVEAQGYVTTHNQDTAAHADIREAIANKAETFVVTISDLKTDSDGYWDSGITDHTAAEIIQAANAGEIVIAKVIQLVSSVSGVTATTYLSLTVSYYKTDSSMVLCCAITDYVSIITAVIYGNTVSFRQGRIGTLETSSVPLASGIAAVGTSDNCARADHVHPKEVSDTDRATWNGKASKPTVTTVILSATGWNSSTKQQTVAVSGILADGTKQQVICSPVDESYDSAWNSCYVQCVGHGADSLTFQCDEIPTAAVEVYVSIQPVSFAS